MNAEADPGATPVLRLVGDTVARIPPEADLNDVTRAMVDADVGALVVVDGDDVVGIVSERDVVRAVAAGLDPGSTQAADLASRGLVRCDATATVGEVAAEMMEEYVRHVLVEDDGNLVGVVSARDLLGVYAAADLGRAGR